MKAEGWLEHRVAESAKDGVHVGVVVQRGVVADAGDGVPGAAAVGSAASQPDLDKVGLQEGGGEPRRAGSVCQSAALKPTGASRGRFAPFSPDLSRTSPPLLRLCRSGRTTLF